MKDTNDVGKIKWACRYWENVLPLPSQIPPVAGRAGFGERILIVPPQDRLRVRQHQCH